MSDIRATNEQEAADARAELEARRHDRERAERAAEREAERARKDVEHAEREREKAERQREKTAQNALKEGERRQSELMRSLRDAEREAGRAQRDAEKAALDAALARQRAERAVDKALRQAAIVEPGPVDEHERSRARLRLPNEIAILWRTVEPAQRGPRPGLSLDRIAQAGIALADGDGLGAVSMARVAESLGFTTMSLYRYVSSKDDVLALMTDAAIGPPPSHVDEPRLPWRAAAEQWVCDHAEILTAHPWLAFTSATLTTLGPNHLAWADGIVAALDGTGLTPSEKLQAAGLLGAHLLTMVRVADGIGTFERSAANRPASDGVPVTSDYLTLMAALVDPTEHPALHAAVIAGGRASAHDDAEIPADVPSPDLIDGWPLDFGARRILDGIGVLIAERRSTESASPT